MSVVELGPEADLVFALACEDNPEFLLAHMACFDERATEEFRFEMFDPEAPWYWQRDVLEWWKAERRSITLKARQIGVTWLACGFGLWQALYRPGSRCLFYRQTHDDAVKLIGRIWYMLNSLPPGLWNGCQVQTPSASPEPHDTIELRFPDGRVSRLIGMTSSSSAGHGETAAFVLLDEYGHVDNAGATMKAVSSAVGPGGRLVIVSTANGVSNDQTGQGNHFHYLWVNAEAIGLSQRFLSWRLHPDRDDDWYAHSPEVLQLKPWERLEQYPDNPHEAFAGTGGAEFFDPSAMHWYRENAMGKLLFRGEFRSEGSPRKARFHLHGTGAVRVYRKPERDHDYAIGADVGTGRGLDYSSAYVVDLDSMALCSEIHSKLEPDRFAEQLDWLGRWYGKAMIGVELGGGFGDAVIYALRDGRDGRPAYPRLYRHRQFLRGDLNEHKAFGFPMTSKTRPEALSFLEESLRDRMLPWVTPRLMDEMMTFVRFNPTKPEQGGTWPRAREGCHDDCVMAAAVTLEMFRQRGSFDHRERRKRRKRASTPVSPYSFAA